MKFTAIFRTCLIMTILYGFLSQTVSTAFGTGIVDEDVIRQMNGYGDNYNFSAVAKSGWVILSSAASGDSGGNWVAAPPPTDGNGNSNYPCGGVTAYGTRIGGSDTAQMFSAYLDGAVRPVGSGGSGSTTYTYSVTARWSDFNLFMDPSQVIVPYGSNGNFALAWLDASGVKHNYPNPFWKCLPDVQTTWQQGLPHPSKPGQYTVMASPHQDNGDMRSGDLGVVAVASVTATPSIGTAASSGTDGWLRYGDETLVKDSYGNNIPENIPYSYSKKDNSVSLSATAKPGEPWPYLNGISGPQYPTWGVSGCDPASVLTSLNGSSSSIKTEAASGIRQIVASCGNNKIINVKFIKVEFSKETLYLTWNYHEWRNVSGYLLGDCYDTSRFAWSASGDAELVLNKGDGTTVYAGSFSPAAEENKPALQKLSFSGYIRFTKPSVQAFLSTNTSVIATSEELPSQTDTLAIIPQFINLSVSGIAEETYNTDGSLSNPRTNEGTIGAFVKINDNDDNGNKNVDREKDTDGSGSDPDLLAVTIDRNISGPINADHPVTLSIGGFYGGGSSIKVWKDAARSELYINGSGSKQFTSAASVPSTVYVEAVGSTSASLSASYSYSDSTTEPTKVYAIGAGDSVRLNGFGVDASVNGLANEATVQDGQSQTVRIMPYEMFPGGELTVIPDGEKHLVAVSFAGNTLIRDGSQMQLGQNEANPDLDRDVTITCASDKVELYRQETDQSYTKLTSPITLKVSDLTKMLYLNPMKDSGSKRDIELKQSYISPQNGLTHEDVIKLTALRLDLDVDSNNDGTVDQDNVDEDKIETTSPGKLVKLDNGDLDGDNITDNVDYNINGNGYSDNIFAEMKLRIPESIKLDNCKITLTYDASTPPATEGGDLGSTGSLRIWKKRSNDSRVVGDYLMPNASGTYYTPTQLLGSGKREATFWIEGVRVPSSGSPASITVGIAPITPRTGTDADLPADESTVPENYSLSDTVVVMPYCFDLDIDSDNNNGYSAPDRSLAEDKIEDDSTKPGKIMSLNNLDTDYDGVPDFADGYDITLNGTNQAGAGKSAVFVPMVLEIPSWVDLDVARVKFTYSASDPASVTVSGSGTAASPYVYSPASGNLRIWTKDGNVSRLKASVASSGDYVPSGTMILASAFGTNRTITFYVEAISPSASAGDLTIKAEFYPFANNTTFVLDDQIRCTVIKVDLDVDSDNDGTVEQNDYKEDVIEEFEPGCIIPVKDSNSDDEKIPVPSNPDNKDIRVPLKLKIEPAINVGTVVISVDSGIKLWPSLTGGLEVTSPQTYSNLANLPDTLYVDGVTANTNPDITMTYKDTAGNTIALDKVKVLVVEPISYAPRKGKLAYVWSSLQSLGTSDGTKFETEAAKAGFSVEWFSDSIATDTDFETCTLANYRKLVESGAYHVISHGDTGEHLAVYAPDTTAGQDACDAWRGTEAGMTTKRVTGQFYYVSVNTTWLASNFSATANTNRTIAHWAICYSASILDSVGGRWKIGYTNPTDETEAGGVIEKLFKDMNGTTNNGTRRTAGKSWDAGGYAANAVMKGYKWTTLTAAPMIKSYPTVHVYPTAAPTDNRLRWGGIVFDSYMNRNIAASDALTFLGSGTGSQDTPTWAGIDAGHSLALGFYLIGTGKTAKAVSVNCRTDDSSATDDENNGRPLDGDGKNGISDPSPDNKEWSW